MKAEIKKARGRKRALKKAFHFLLMVVAAYFAVVQLYPAYLKFHASCRKIETAEIDSYYNLLSKHARPPKEFVLSLGVKDSDNLQLAIDRLKDSMGIGAHKIWLAHHDAEKPPAYIKELGYGDMGLVISSSIKERREEINLLVHELGHIYVWGMDPSIFGKCRQEKLNDCAGVFLGFGLLTLNGLTDEFRLVPEGYETRKKFFGYLKPEQFGYLVARYCADHGVSPDAVKPFLNPSGRKYFDIGREYLNRAGYKGSGSAGPVTGVYWCPKCGTPVRFPLTGKTGPVKCPKCAG